MNKITLCENTFEPSTWKTFDNVINVRDFLVDHFGIWPETARIYLDHVADNADITPHDDAGIERLGKATGHFFVVVYPEGIEIILLVVALVVAAVAIGLSFLFRPSANLKNTQQSSANNHLADRENTARPNERIPDIYGQVWGTPDLIAVPYRVFIANAEIEYCYMCLGRGVYEIDRIREDVTDVKDIDGYSCEVYQPFTSPNSGDDPIIRIGPAINTKVINLQVFGAVNGQIMQPPNATFKGNGSDIKFVYPNQIVNDGTDDFTNYFADPTAAGHDVYIKIGGLRSNDDVASDPGFSIHSAHLGGVYKTLAVTPNVITLDNPGAVNGNWSVVNSFVGHQSRFVLDSNDSAGDNLISVGPGGGPNTNNFTDKFKMLYPQMTELWCNFVCPQGCYKIDKNGNQLAPVITMTVRVQSCDLAGNPVGTSFSTNIVLTGSVNDRSQKGVTLKIVLPPGFASTGGILVDVRRASNEDHSDGIQITDQVQWRDCYIVSPVTQKDFGNVTTVQTIVRPTPQALQIKARKLNMLVTRAVSIFAGVVPGNQLFTQPFNFDYLDTPATPVLQKRVLMDPNGRFVFVIADNGERIQRWDLASNTINASGVPNPATAPGGIGTAWTVAGGRTGAANGDLIHSALTPQVTVDGNGDLWACIIIASHFYLICYDGFSFNAKKAVALEQVVNTVSIAVPLCITYDPSSDHMLLTYHYGSDDVQLLQIRRCLDGALIGNAPLQVSPALSTGFPTDVDANLVIAQDMSIAADNKKAYVLTFGQHIAAGGPYTTYDWYIHVVDPAFGTSVVGPFVPSFFSNHSFKYVGDASLGKGVAMTFDTVNGFLFVFTDTGVIHKIAIGTMAIVDTLGTGASPAYKFNSSGTFNKLSGVGVDGGLIFAMGGKCQGLLVVPDPLEVGSSDAWVAYNTADWSVDAHYDVTTIISTPLFSDTFAWDFIGRTMIIASQDVVNILGDATSFHKTYRVFWNPPGTPTFAPIGATKNAGDIIVSMSLDPFIGNRVLEEIDVIGIHALLDPGGIIETYFGVVGYASAPCEFCYTFDDSKVSFEESLADVATAVFCTAYRRGNIIMLSFEQQTENSTVLFNHRNKIPKSETRTVSFGSLNDQDGVSLDYIEPNAPNYPDLDTTLTLYFPPDQSARNPKKVTSIGIRNRQQATIFGWRMYRKMILQNTVVQFDATQEAALCVLQDRILVADNTRADVQDGEVIDQAALLLTLSQDVVFDILQTYTIFLQHPDQTIESIAITAGPNANQVVLGLAPSVPCVVDTEKFARTTYLIVGSAPTRKSSMLLIEKTPKSGMQYEVKAVNYTDAYYDHDRDFVTTGGFGSNFGRFGE